MPYLEAVVLSGSGDVSVDGLRGDLFQVDMSDAGGVEAVGQVGRVEADLWGAAELLEKLIAREVKVDLSGAGEIRVHATESLDASVSGARPGALLRRSGRC